MKARVTIIATTLALIAVALFGYAQVTKYLERQTRAENALAESKKSVARVTAAVEASLNDELDKSSATTYAELFSQTDDRLKMVDTSIIDTQASEIKDEVKKSLLDYLRSSENMIRLRTQMYRKGLSFSNAVDEVKRAREDYAASPYNEYSDASERRRIEKARTEAATSIGEFKESQAAYLGGLVALRSTIGANDKTLSGFELINKDILAKAIEKARAS